MQIDRDHAAQLGRETVRILQAGRYQTASGATVDIQEPLTKAVRATISYPPEAHIPAARPGGGFLNGARAQEESLVRSSGLYACIAEDPMYAFHRARHDPVYTDYVIYSPDPFIGPFERVFG